MIHLSNASNQGRPLVVVRTRVRRFCLGALCALSASCSGGAGPEGTECAGGAAIGPFGPEGGPATVGDVEVEVASGWLASRTYFCVAQASLAEPPLPETEIAGPALSIGPSGTAIEMRIRVPFDAQGRRGLVAWRPDAGSPWERQDPCDVGDGSMTIDVLRPGELAVLRYAYALPSSPAGLGSGSATTTLDGEARTATIGEPGSYAVFSGLPDQESISVVLQTRGASALVNTRFDFNATPAGIVLLQASYVETLESTQGWTYLIESDLPGIDPELSLTRPAPHRLRGSFTVWLYNWEDQTTRRLDARLDLTAERFVWPPDEPSCPLASRFP